MRNGALGLSTWPRGRKVEEATLSIILYDRLAVNDYLTYVQGSDQRLARSDGYVYHKKE